MTTSTSTQNDERLYTTVEVFDGDVFAAFTNLTTDQKTDRFSFRRMAGNPEHDLIVQTNLRTLGARLGFDPSQVTYPNGGWPHSGRVIIAEDRRFDWVIDLISGGIAPTEEIAGQTAPVTYDGIVTRDPGFILGAQAADCSTTWFHDPVGDVIGIAHCGWKPVVRGVITNVIAAMVELGSNPADITIHIGPGAGREYNEFRDEDYVMQVFKETQREYLLAAPFQVPISPAARDKLERILHRPVTSDISFAVSTVIEHDLVAAGVLMKHVTFDEGSTMLDPTLPSFRRDAEAVDADGNLIGHTLNQSVIFFW